MEQVLEQYIDKLVEEKNFGELEPEVLAQIKSDIGERLERRINASLLEHMPENKLDELEQKMNANDVEGVRKLCEDSIPDLQEVIAQTLLDFRRTYLGV